MSKPSPFRRSTRASKLVRRTTRRPRNQSGVALLTTLLLLILVSLLGLTMAVTTNSDMMINSYYGSYRGSFYAADSGLNIARATVINQLNSTSHMNLTPCVSWGPGAAPGCTSPPLNTTNAVNDASNNLTTSYGGSFQTLNAGQAAKSWAGSFMIPSAINNCTTSVTLASVTPGAPAGPNQYNSYAYTFNYELCSVGRAQAAQQVATKEDGSVIVTVSANSTGGVPAPGSFAAFGGFIDHFGVCQGPLAPGTMTGRFFTNGAWNFGTSGSYIFTDPVGQANANADYWISGNCYQSPTSSYTKSGQTIKPTFQAGLSLGQSAVPLPADSFSQLWAVMDGLGNGTESPATPGATQLNANLKNISGTSYPTGGASSGVYIPYCTGGAGCTSPNTVLGGGFYIEGSANIQLSLGTDGSGNPTQTYAITQGSTTTTITLNNSANSGVGSTKIVSGSTTLTLTGIPHNLRGTTSVEGAVLYVNGTVSNLGGTGQGVASIQDHYGTTVTANGSINVTGDLIYKHEPVTLNTTDALVAGNDYDQVMGLFTANGDIIFKPSYSNHNLEIDASMAALNSSCTSSSPSSQCGFATSGTVGTVTVVGGRIESNAHSVSLTALNTYFDRRFTSRTDGFAPPAFPATTLPATGPPVPLAPDPPTATVQRLTWVTWPQ